MPAVRRYGCRSGCHDGTTSPAAPFDEAVPRPTRNPPIAPTRTSAALMTQENILRILPGSGQLRICCWMRTLRRRVHHTGPDQATGRCT